MQSRWLGDQVHLPEIENPEHEFICPVSFFSEIVGNRIVYTPRHVGRIVFPICPTQRKYKARVCLCLFNNFDHHSQIGSPWTMDHGVASHKVVVVVGVPSRGIPDAANVASKLSPHCSSNSSLHANVMRISRVRSMACSEREGGVDSGAFGAGSNCFLP